VHELDDAEGDAVDEDGGAVLEVVGGDAGADVGAGGRGEGGARRGALFLFGFGSVAGGGRQRARADGGERAAATSAAASLAALGFKRGFSTGHWRVRRRRYGAPHRSGGEDGGWPYEARRGARVVVLLRPLSPSLFLTAAAAREARGESIAMVFVWELM
jgi:hypothetical protein